MKYTLLLFSFTALLSAGDWRFNGFLTAAGGYLVDGDGSLNGYSDEFNFKPDSVLALQVAGDISDKWSVTGQWLSEDAEDFNAVTQWAYVSYKPNDDWLVRAGRLRAPWYTLSDYVDVGYAYPWVRPPSDVYSLPFNNFNGLDAIRFIETNNISHTIQAFFGNEKTDNTTVEYLDIDNLFGMSWSGTHDIFSVRIGYNRGQMKTGEGDLGELLGTLRSLGFEDQANALSTNDKLAEFIQFGVTFEPGNFVGKAEYTTLKFDKTLFQDNSSWYAMVGYKLDDLLFHFTATASAPDLKGGYADNIPNIPPLQPLIASIEGLIASQDYDNQSFILGLRWDIKPGLAFKFEYEDRETGVFETVDQGLVSFALDAVF